MAFSFIVEVKDMRLGVFLFFAFHERFNGLDMWKCLHPEFTIESTSERVEDLIFLLFSMPH